MAVHAMRVIPDRFRIVERTEDEKYDLERWRELVNARSIPLPWHPPLRAFEVVRPAHVHQRLVAEACMHQIAPTAGAMESVDLDGAAHEVRRLVSLLDAITRCRP